MKKKTGLPPRDSWIRLAPGKAIRIDESLSKIWNEKRREWREVRGNILAACFEVEYLLDQVLRVVFFPRLDEAPSEKDTRGHHMEANEDAQALERLFDELFLKSALISFRRKIDLLRDLSSRIPALQRLMPKDIVYKLDKIRDVRNRFAHYPVTFTPVGDPPIQELCASLVCGDKELTLDKNFFDEYNPLFSSILAEMEEMLKRLKEDRHRV